MKSEVLGEGWGPYAGMPRSKMEELQSLPVGAFFEEAKGSSKNPPKQYKGKIIKLVGNRYMKEVVVVAKNARDAEDKLYDMSRFTEVDDTWDLINKNYVTASCSGVHKV